ncbi:MAG: hypothetical protein M1818_004339 [Claussenomyces sp. TS43310]|nr:MAG: hypothetical protein M1818_004339 [Claussenomyces sp. TS43310]
MELDFVTLDVFTSTPYEGNPLALIKVPAQLKDGLSQQQKQTIAREFNLSESVFLHEKAAGLDEWAVDIFTPERELPFAGHPTVGAACYILSLSKRDIDSTVLVTKAGRMPVTKTKSGAITVNVSHNVHIHKNRISSLPDPGAASSPNGQLAELETQAPLVSIVKGMTFMLVELPSLELLGEAHKTSRRFDLSPLLDQGWNEGFVGRLYYVLDRRDGSDGLLIRARMIEAKIEDPATGSAAGALGSYLALTGVGLEGNKCVYQITQGVEMGRKSVIGLEVEVNAGGNEIQSVRLSGTAVKVMEGRLTI